MVRLSHWEILPFDYFFNLKSHKQHLLRTGLVAVPLHLTGFPSSLPPLSLATHRILEPLALSSSMLIPHLKRHL